MGSGRPWMRASAVKAMVAQICREAVARVKTNVRLADLTQFLPEMSAASKSSRQASQLLAVPHLRSM